MGLVGHVAHRWRSDINLRVRGVKRTNCSTTTTGNTALLTQPEGRADPSAALAPRQNQTRGALAPDRTPVLGLGMDRVINERDTGSKYLLLECVHSFCGVGEGKERH